MSQSSRSHARRFERWRVQSAGLIARTHPQWVAIWNNPGESEAAAILAGDLTFDVHAARELATSMIVMVADQDAFEDWTRVRGLGPENREKSAFAAPCTGCEVWGNCAIEHKSTGDERGGWPGNLALEYTNEQVACGVCVGGWVGAKIVGTWADGATMTATAYHSTLTLDGEWLDDRFSQGFGFNLDRIGPGIPREAVLREAKDSFWDGVKRVDFTTPNKDNGRRRCPRCWEKRSKLRQAPMGRSIARVGRRLLDMLDGRCAWAPSAGAQPSECQRRACIEGRLPAGLMFGKPTREHACQECKGTGHNLRGVVPAVEWPAVVRRRYHDAVAHAAPRAPGSGDGRVRLAPWLLDLKPSWELPDPAVSTADELRVTRVVPRGEHRNLSTETPRDQLRGWIPKGGFGPECWPRWRHGEIKHRAGHQRNYRALRHGDA